MDAPRRYVRIFVAAVVVAAAALGAAVSGDAREASRAGAGSAVALPKLPPYIDQLGVSLGLYTNASWLDLSSRRPALQLRRAGGGGGDPYFSIWTRTCRPGRQVARFSRRVYLPGPPSAEQPGTTGRAIMALDGAERWEVRFNGSSVYRGRPTAGTRVPLARAQLRKLHRGANTIELTATKPAVACSRFGGVSFGLAAPFVADLYVYQGGSSIRYDDVGTSEGAVIPGRLTIGNRGPTEAAYGTFHLQMSHASSYGYWELFPEAQGALKNCQKTETTSTFDVHCEWVGFPPTATGALAYILRFTVTRTPWPDAEIVMSYSITGDHGPYRGPIDPNVKDNSRQLRLVLCGPLSTREGCKNPTS